MKVNKLALASVLVPLAAALATAPSAIANSTALCSYTPVYSEQCEGSLVSHVHEATIASEPAKLLTSLLTVECDVLFLGDTSGGTLGSPLKIVGNFTYTNCSDECIVWEFELAPPSVIEALKEGHEKAKVTGAGEVFVECGSWFECTYDGEGLKGTAKGWWLTPAAYPNGEVVISNQLLHKVPGSDFFCPKESKLDIIVTPLSRMLIGS
jgi:hypothetical protein